ncbi:hypothetical protein [Mucilaginibacter sp. CSA2-8R]|uniref:hypothetical protein n=1 Tax=Mucilaginibacter sp. CSA2-8R TaxID=3141542 RepID=UPI00315D2EDB
MIKLIAPPHLMKVYLKRHCDKLLPLIRTRLDQPENLCLKDHFKTDGEILEILAAKPNDLVPLHEKIVSDLEKLHLPVKVWTALEKAFNETEFFRKERVRYNAYTLVRSLKQPTCLYCNIHQIAPVYLEKKISRPPIDHFFASDLYPGLSLSFYNLIPACTACNTIKSNKPTSTVTHTHPYLLGFGDDCMLTLSNFRNLDDLTGKKIKPFKIVFDNPTIDKRYEGNISLFALAPTYQTYRGKAHWVMRTMDQRSKAAVDSALKLVPGVTDVNYWDVFGVDYEIEAHKRSPYSKLTRDLVRQYASQEIKTLLSI